MAAKNKHVLRSKISEAKFRQLARLFCVDLSAKQIAQVTGLNRNTVDRLLMGIRERVAAACEAWSPVSGEAGVDESYFGARRVKGARGRGALGKTIVFGLFKGQGRVYTEVAPDCSRATPRGIIRGRIEPGGVIHSDGWRGYDGPVDIGHSKHCSVKHGENEFANPSGAVPARPMGGRTSTA
jgi:transposase-like protein